MNYLTRSLTGSIKSSGGSFSCHCVRHRRYYSEKKPSINHYDALGVNSNASVKEIKTAFYKLSKKHHPDVNPDDANAAHKFSIISNAYDVLGDAVKRREYDAELTSRDSSSYSSVMYDRSSAYAQRARAHRPSAWKPPPSSKSSSGGFQGTDNAFGNSRSSSYGTFDKNFYDSAFGRYRGPLPKGRSNVYDFDEFYRSHYSEFTNWNAIRKEAQEKVRREQEEQKAKRQERASRSWTSKVSTTALWISGGLVILFIISVLHEMQFQKPTEELRSNFYIISKPKRRKPHEEPSTKS
ncbi:unnamed protein product [Adineta ricciae]|uniref:J domain-containing protein n=1 Tax=Adineta ricciae TaxID=249248 RepID=A0A814ADP0_ADIRI|nr:unnamed protein product [Adineta ricciae]CAF1146393.1 unnamed protein product [Adineta ricciae]